MEYYRWGQAVGLRKQQNGEAWGEVYMEMQVGFRRGGSLTSKTNCPFKALVQVKLYIKEKRKVFPFSFFTSLDHMTTFFQDLTTEVAGAYIEWFSYMKLTGFSME